MRQALGIYETHCKNNFISQIPNLLKQRALMTKEKVKDVVENRDHGTEKESDNLETRLIASKK